MDNEFRKEIMDNFKSLHDKYDAGAIKMAVLQSTVEGTNARVSIQNGNVAKLMIALTELEKVNIRNEAILEERRKEVDGLKARIDADGRVIIDLQDQVKDYPLLKRVVWGAVGITLAAVLGWLLIFTPFSKR